MVLPTFNEASNLEDITELVLEAAPEVSILIIDDNSPDGTGKIADSLAKSNPDRVFVLHRGGKQGLGTAYRLGFAWGLRKEYDIVGQMDTDGSHDPQAIPLMLREIQAGCFSIPRIVIGSRWVEGGVVSGVHRRRVLLSKLANLFAKFTLRLKTQDVTSGFRLMTSSALRASDFSKTTSVGYAFQIEMTLQLERCSAEVLEIPITFIDRKSGASKMSLRIIFESVYQILGWFLRGLILKK